MKNRNLKDFAVIGVKGALMGAADVVPGVSGGTIAFITGIYEELIHSIKSVSWESIKPLFKGNIRQVWQNLNASFLVALIGGIGISILSLAKVITYLLKTQPVLIWSLFFGLIIASAVLIGKDIKKWNVASILSILVGAGIAYYITIASPAETPHTTFLIFISGAIAICAMILPGISGSFILLLLGKYRYIFEAISTLNIKVLLTFIVGCVVGLLTFSRVLDWLFKHHKNTTIALLTGFMIGSLNKVWPWKKVLTTRVNSHGETVTVTDMSILPNSYDGDPQVIMAIVLMLVGIGLIAGMHFVSTKMETTK